MAVQDYAELALLMALPRYPLKPRTVPVACLFIPFAIAGPAAEIGEPAPELHLAFPLAKPLDPKLSHSSLRGRALMLEFWATWCLPCIDAIPHLNQLIGEFRNEPIDFIAITEEDEPLVRRFLGDHPIDGLIAIDADGRTSKAFGLTFLPSTVLIDAKGNLAAITNPDHIDAAALRNLMAGEAIQLPAPIGLGNPDALVTVVLRRSIERESDVSSEEGKLTIQGADLRTILSRAYGLPPSRIQVPEDLEVPRYDALIQSNGATASVLFEMLKLILPTGLNVKIESESREASVLVLSVRPGTTLKLRKTAGGGETATGGDGFLRFKGTSLSHLADAIQHLLGQDVVDESGLPDRYDLNLTWNRDKPESIKAAVREQLGLSLAPGTRRITFVSVRKL